jgi:hypothetical protein
MEDIDVNILIQVFNEKISSLMTDIVVKDTTIRQLTIQLESLKAASAAASTAGNNKKQVKEDFE